MSGKFIADRHTRKPMEAVAEVKQQDVFNAYAQRLILLYYKHSRTECSNTRANNPPPMFEQIQRNNPPPMSRNKAPPAYPPRPSTNSDRERRARGLGSVESLNAYFPRPPSVQPEAQRQTKNNPGDLAAAYSLSPEGEQQMHLPGDLGLPPTYSPTPVSSPASERQTKPVSNATYSSEYVPRLRTKTGDEHRITTVDASEHAREYATRPNTKIGAEHQTDTVNNTKYPSKYPPQPRANKENEQQTNAANTTKRQPGNLSRGRINPAEERNIDAVKHSPPYSSRAVTNTGTEQHSKIDSSRTTHAPQYPPRPQTNAAGERRINASSGAEQPPENPSRARTRAALTSSSSKNSTTGTP